MITMMAALVWTPITFYVAMGIFHTLAILIGFRLLHIDPENNTIVGAVIGAVIINVIAYFVRDYGIVSIIVQIGVMFGMLVAVASGEALKASLMAILMLAAYGGAATVLIPRTPLTEDQIGGFAKVILAGGLKEEAMTEKDFDSLEKNGMPIIESEEPDYP